MNEARSILKHSAVYLAASVLNRGTGFFLILVYTHFLEPAEYGILGVIVITGEIASSAVALRLGTAMWRFYFDNQHEENRREVVSTAIIGICGLILASLPLFLLLARPLSVLVLGSQRGGLLLIGVVGLLLNSIFFVGLNYLRASRLSSWVLIASTLRSVGYLGLNSTLVIVFDLGVAGALVGTLIANAVAAAALVLPILISLGARFSRRKFTAMLRFGLPLIPGDLAEIGGKFAERFLLVRLGSLSAAGVYFLGFRFGDLLASLLLSSFAHIYAVHRHEANLRDKPDAEGPRMFTYFFLVVTTVALTVASLAPQIIALVAPPQYGKASAVIPLILFSVVIFSLTIIVELGIYYVKVPQRITVATISMLAVHVPLSMLLINLWGIVGAATARCFSVAFRVALTAVLARGLGGPKPQWLRLAVILVSGAATFTAGRLLPESSPYALTGRIVLCIAFPLVLVGSPLFDHHEREALRRLLANGWQRLTSTRRDGV